MLGYFEFWLLNFNVQDTIKSQNKDRITSFVNRKL